MSQDVTMDRTAADLRARADVARSINTHVTDLTKSYQSKITDASAEEVEEWVVTATKAFTEMDLVGAAIVDRHRCKRDNAYYSLARMDVAAYGRTIDAIERLSEKAREAIKEHADDVFDEMSKLSKQSK